MPSTKEYQEQYRKLNREKILFQKREHYIANRDRLLAEKRAEYQSKKEQKLAYQKQYYENNKEARAFAHKEYFQKNPNYYKEFRKKYPEKLNAKEVKRKTSKMHRTPSWLTPVDFERIQNVYKLAAIQTKLTGQPWHVDHIIPLQGRLVSGLHVPSNLQAIKGSENCRKKNKFEVI